jgi:lipid-binding SYLF domain-containing protein
MSLTRLSRRLLLIAIVAACWSLAAPPADAKSAVEIDVGVDETLKRFFAEVGGAKALADKSAGLLVFPTVIKAGFGIGGEYGEGALRIGGETADYYNTAAASIGLQFGAQARSVILMFMTDEALDEFRRSDGWEVGVDGSVALITIGAGGAIDSHSITDPIIGFVFGEKGLMYNLTLEGSKMTKLNK